nr:hypothetical protein [Brachybacterium faecium]
MRGDVVAVQRLDPLGEAQANAKADQLREQVTTVRESFDALRAVIPDTPTTEMQALMNRIRDEEAQLHQFDLQLAERTEDGRPRTVPL